MRIQRKVVNQLLLTSSEVESLLQLVKQAKEGRTVHYAEKRMDNGTFFGIGVDMPEDKFADGTARNDYPTPVSKY